MNKKYELTKKSYEIDDVFFFQIRALRSFGNIKKGELGGWVENENNLSHKGDCWISDDAQVFDTAQVSDHAQISGNVQISDNARIFGNAWIFDSVKISGDAQISGNAWISGNVKISKNVKTNFDFSTLAPSISEVTIDGVKYVKETIWKKQN